MMLPAQWHGLPAACVAPVCVPVPVPAVPIVPVGGAPVSSVGGAPVSSVDGAPVSSAVIMPAAALPGVRALPAAAPVPRRRH